MFCRRPAAAGDRALGASGRRRPSPPPPRRGEATGAAAGEAEAAGRCMTAGRSKAVVRRVGRGAGALPEDWLAGAWPGAELGARAWAAGAALWGCGVGGRGSPWENPRAAAGGANRWTVAARPARTLRAAGGHRP